MPQTRAIPHGPVHDLAAPLLHPRDAGKVGQGRGTPPRTGQEEATSVTSDGARISLFPTLLDHLLRAEPALRRKRPQVAASIAVLFALLAVADARFWPERSFAPGYAIPIVLGAYAFGLRVGVVLSVLGVTLRILCAGRTYGPWWLYAGSALTLGEYLILALGVGLLGRAVRRFERHTKVLAHLSDDARDLTRTLAPDAVLRR